MSKSSRKGDSRENERAADTGGEKVSRKGYEGADVVHPPLVLRSPLRICEVKSKEDLPLWLVGVDKNGNEGWITQMEREGADYIAFRQNRQPWYVIMRADRLGPEAEDGLPLTIEVDGVTYTRASPEGS